MNGTTNGMANGKWQMGNGKWSKIHLPFAISLLPFAMPLAVAAPTASSPGGGKSVTPEEMEVQIKGQFKGRLLIKKIVAPVTMNLEKLQDFPEDPSQKILLGPLPLSPSAEFNARSGVKGHAPFTPWIPAV